MFNFLNQLFSGLFTGAGGGAGVAPAPAAPDPVMNFFGMFPDLGEKYANGFLGHREAQNWEPAAAPASEPVTSLTDAVMAPFQASSTAASAPTRTYAERSSITSAPVAEPGHLPPQPGIETPPARVSQADRPSVSASPAVRDELATRWGTRAYDITLDGDMLSRVSDQGLNPNYALTDSGPNGSVRAVTPEERSRIASVPISGTLRASGGEPGETIRATTPRPTSQARQLTFEESIQLRTGPNMYRAAANAEHQLSRTPKDTKVAAARIPSAIAAIVDQHAEAAGIDKALARRIVHIESSGNPNAVTGSYKGLFQLSRAEFKRFGGGNIFDANDNAKAGLLKLAAERDHLAKLLGRDVTPAEIYLAHQQGIGGAVKHLSNPDQPAWLSMYQTGEGQQKGARWAKRAIWGNIPSNLKRQFGSVDNITSAQFVELWRKKVEG
jgi:hypothetical protein